MYILTMYISDISDIIDNMWIYKQCWKDVGGDAGVGVDEGVGGVDSVDSVCRRCWNHSFWENSLVWKTYHFYLYFY